MQLKKYIVIYKEGWVPQVWDTETYKEVDRNNPDHFKEYRILVTFSTDEPPPASAEEEAERLYPCTSPIGSSDRSLAETKKEAHITCAGMYTGEISRLTDENHKLMAENDTISEELGETKELFEACKSANNLMDGKIETLKAELANTEYLYNGLREHIIDLKVENSKMSKQAKTELLWELIQDWQDARDIGEDIHAPKFSFNDIETDLYEWMEKIEPGSRKEKYSGSVTREPIPGVQLNRISPEARDLLGKIMEAWEPHYEGLKAGNKDYEPGFYGFAYWLVRWSGLVQPLTSKTP